MLAAPPQTTLSLLPFLTRIVTIVMVVMSHFTLLTTSSHRTESYHTNWQTWCSQFPEKMSCQIYIIFFLKDCNFERENKNIILVMSPWKQWGFWQEQNGEKHFYTTLKIWICSTFIARRRRLEKEQREAPDPAGHPVHLRQVIGDCRHISQRQLK